MKKKKPLPPSVIFSIPHKLTLSEKEWQQLQKRLGRFRFGPEDNRICQESKPMKKEKASFMSRLAFQFTMALVGYLARLAWRLRSGHQELPRPPIVKARKR